MSSRPAARGSEAARSIRLALRTSSMVAVSSASPSRCFLFWPGRRARIASLIVLATVAIPPTTQPHPLPIRPHAPRRRLGCAAQETMGGELSRLGTRAQAWAKETTMTNTTARRRGPGAMQGVDRHVARRIRERRLELGLTQQQLAELVGITYQQAHKYEKGDNRVAVGRLYLIARALDVEPAYFFEGLGARTAGRFERAAADDVQARAPL